VDWLPAAQVATEVEELLTVARSSLRPLFCFKSVHTALLQPGRLAAWLEGAVKLTVADCMELVELYPALLDRQRPAPQWFMPEEAPGRVSAARWKEGALQLRQEVRTCA
jgi:hypothetical protein